MYSRIGARSFAVMFSVSTLVSCSSAPLRSPWADKSMRVCLSPEGISAQDAAAITTELVKSNKFMIVDRSRGLQSVKREQDTIHKIEPDRYADREKYAIYGRLYGCGSVAVAHSQCFRNKPFFNFSSSPYQLVCHQYLSLVDTNSGEIITAVNGKSKTPAGAANWGAESFTEPPEWEGTVTKLIDAYPRDFKPKFYSEGMENYRDTVQEEAVRQREPANQRQESYGGDNRKFNSSKDLQFMRNASDKAPSQE